MHVCVFGYVEDIEKGFVVRIHHNIAYIHSHIYIYTIPSRSYIVETWKLFTLLSSHQWDANNKTKFALYLCWRWRDSIFFHYIVLKCWVWRVHLLSRLILIKKVSKVSHCVFNTRWNERDFIKLYGDARTICDHHKTCKPGYRMLRHSLLRWRLHIQPL